MVNLDRELHRMRALRLWEERLQQSDSVFAQLVFVSQLRNVSGRYSDPFLSAVFPARTCHEIMADAHRHIFREWLGLGTRVKLRDFQKYWEATCRKDAAEEAAWASMCRELVPSGISIDELDLFFGDAKRLAHIICRRQCQLE